MFSPENRLRRVCATCEDWLEDGGVWERVSVSFAQHSREDV